MAKTGLTKKLEDSIYIATKKMGTFACFEVTIGIGGSERVDYITYDTKGIWRCYEIKVSKSDFYSKAAKTFCGHFNYFVMPHILYEEVKSDVPDYVGVYTDKYYPSSCVKKPKKKELEIDENILKDSMIRSLARDSEKLRKLSNADYVERTHTQIKNLQEDKRRQQERYNELLHKFYELKDSGIDK